MIKKITLLSLFGVLFLIDLNGQTSNKKKTNVETEFLSGNVKQVNQFYYEAWDKSGKIVLGARSTTFGDNKQLNYDIKGNLMEVTIYKSDSSIYYKYGYDTSGNILDGTIHKYKSTKKQIEEKTYSTQGNYEGKIVSQFDEKGNKTEEISYDSKDTFVYRRTFKYDEMGNQVEYALFNNKNSFVKMEDQKSIFKYDIHGNVIEANVFDEQNKLIYQEKYKYEFDKQGNWIKKTIMYTDGSKVIFVREITYY